MGKGVSGLGASELSETADLMMGRALEKSRNTDHLHMGCAHFPLRQTKKKKKKKATKHTLTKHKNTQQTLSLQINIQK